MEKPTKNKLFIVALLTAFLLLTVLLLSSEQDAPKYSTTENLGKIRLGLPLQPTSVLAMLAIDKGYFGKYGLDIEVENYVSGKRALFDGLISGKVDVVTASDTPTVYASFTHPELRVIASIYATDNTNRIVARRDHGITEPADLKGKHIATQGRSAVHYFLHQFLLEKQLQESDLTLSFLKAEQLPVALAAGEIDAFSMREPYVQQARDLLGENAVVFAAPGAYRQSEQMVILESLQKERPGVSRALLSGLLDAEKFWHDDRDAALKILGKWLNLPTERVRKLTEGSHANVHLEQALLIRLEDEAQWMIDDKIVEQDKQPDFLRLLSTAPLLEVAPAQMGLIQ